MVAATVLLTMVLALNLSPTLARAEEHGMPGGAGGSYNSDFGIYDDLGALLDEKDEYAYSRQITAETDAALDFAVRESDIPEEANEYSRQAVPAPHPLDETPYIFDAVENYPSVGQNNDILDWVLNQPLNYYVHTQYGSKETWEKGMLRPTLVLPKYDLQMDYGWNYLDVDHNRDTGPGGSDLRVRMRLKLNDVDLQLLPPALNMKGGFVIETERLQNSTGTMPIEVSIMKSVSYEGLNYIIINEVAFADLPPRFTATIDVDTIEAKGTISQIWSALTSGGNVSLSDISLAQIAGPYNVTWNSTEALSSLEVMLGLSRVKDLRLAQRSWALLGFQPGSGLDHVPQVGGLWINAENFYSPLDTLHWRGGGGGHEPIPTRLTVTFVEDRGENLTCSRLMVGDMPPLVEVSIHYDLDDEGKPLTVVDYTASNEVGFLMYQGLDFPYHGSGRDDLFNMTHVEIDDLPPRFHLEVISTVNRGDPNITSPETPLGVISLLLDSLVRRVANKIYRIGKTLRDIPQNMLSLPSREGWMKLEAKDGKHFGSLFFAHTSGDFILREGTRIPLWHDTPAPVYSGGMTGGGGGEVSAGGDPDPGGGGNGTPYPGPGVWEGDYLAFINDTHDDPDDILSDTAIAGYIRGLESINTSFAEGTDAVIHSRGGHALEAVSMDGDDSVTITLSNVPAYLKLSVLPDVIRYSSVKDGHYEAGNRLSELTMVSRSPETYAAITVSDLPYEFEILKSGRVIEFDAGPNDYVGALDFRLSDDPDSPLLCAGNGSYALVKQSRAGTVATGRLEGLKHFYYDPGDEGSMSFTLEESTDFRAMLRSDLEDHLEVDIYIHPLPSQMDLVLPGVVNGTLVRVPDVVNISGILDVSGSILAFKELALDLIDIMGKLNSQIIEQVGSLGSELSFEYELDTYGDTLDIVARIRKGESDELESGLGWTHGIVMAQREVEDGGSGPEMAGHIYLQGLPQRASITTNLTQDRMFVDLELENYDPIYNWLIVDTRGIQGRDSLLFIDGLPPGNDLHIKVELEEDMSIGGHIVAKVDVTSSMDLGRIYTWIRKPEPMMSVREMFFPTVPYNMSVQVALSDSVDIVYSSSRTLEYIYVRLSRVLDEKWHHMYTLVHDVPTWFEVKLESNDDFDVTKPMPLQGLPDITLLTGDDTLDLFAKINGATLGQKGSFTLFVQDVNNTRVRMDGDTYKIRSSGIGNLALTMRDLPLFPQYRMDAVEILGVDVLSIDFTVRMLFGIYPIFQIGGARGGGIELNIHHRLKLFGEWREAKVALVDISYSEWGGSRIPTSAPVYVNTLSSDMRERRHTIIPAPLLTFAFSGTLF